MTKSCKTINADSLAPASGGPGDSPAPTPTTATDLERENWKALEWLSSMRYNLDLFNSFIQGLERGDFRAVPPALSELLNAEMRSTLEALMNEANVKTFAVLARIKNGEPAAL